MLEQTGEQVRASHTPDARLAEALRPAVTTALRNTVRDEPRMWADALFPVLLPAVRIAVSSALRGMVRTLNQALEQSLSLRSWKWRLEAWRTAKTLAEVVLLRTLVYRVEQLLLMDRRTGLLLASVAADDVVPHDNQLVSAMLTALQDFVADSFDIKTEGGIRELHVGEFILLVETGPRAALAAAVRGNPPSVLRETLRAAIDLIHQEFLTELVNFRDDTGPFEKSKTILEGCLQAQYQTPQSGSYTKVWILVAVVVAALATWLGFRVVEDRRWDRAVSVLRNTPGIVITQSERYHLEGLRDPIATRPETLLENDGIDLRKVSLHFRPYLSLDPEIALQRARTALDAPDTVALSLDQGVLRASGAAPHSWLLQAGGAAARLTLLGIRGIDLDGVTDRDMETLRAAIESARAGFDTGSSEFTPAQQRAAEAIAAQSRRWVDYATETGRTPRITVFGYTDPTGEDESNRALSRQRADRLARVLAAAGIPPAMLSAEGRGKAQDRGADKALQRCAFLELRSGR